MTIGAKELERSARNGELGAMVALGRQSEAQRNNVLARGWFARAAKAGSREALRLLAINLLTQEPVAAADGVNMVRAAADKGDAEAAHVCAVLAAQDDNLENRWDIAEKCLRHAAGLGSSFAEAQLDFLARESIEPAAARARQLFDAPRVATFERFAPPPLCDWLIERARPRLERAKVYDRGTGGGRLEEARNNSSAEFNAAQSDVPMMRLRARILASIGLSTLKTETPSVLHYAPGQQFEPHVDFLDPAEPGYLADLQRNGQRAATFLLYLNEDYEGGETDFPNIAWRYKGQKGDALLFWNVDSSGAPDSRTFHAGRPPTSGEKWVFSQWLRQPYASLA
jgi:prolyl 4-hydroxylase